MLLLLEFGGALVLWSEEDGTAATSIKTGGEALWWSTVSITTVGYGDYFPVTTTGRLVGVIMMFGGIALISVLTAVISRFVLSHDRVGPQNGQSCRDQMVSKELADLRAMVELLAESGRRRVAGSSQSF